MSELEKEAAYVISAQDGMKFSLLKDLLLPGLRSAEHQYDARNDSLDLTADNGKLWFSAQSRRNGWRSEAITDASGSRIEATRENFQTEAKRAAKIFFEKAR